MNPTIFETNQLTLNPTILETNFPTNDNTIEISKISSLYPKSSLIYLTMSENLRKFQFINLIIFIF